MISFKQKKKKKACAQPHQAHSKPQRKYYFKHDQLHSAIAGLDYTEPIIEYVNFKRKNKNENNDLSII